MHKFFCNYNTLTGKYELSGRKNNIFSNNVLTQSENDVMVQIKKDIENLYGYVCKLKENTKAEKHLEKLDEIELLISNLYYSIFASPMDTDKTNENDLDAKQLLTKSVELSSELEKLINIPEYNRISQIIRNEFQNILNELD